VNIAAAHRHDDPDVARIQPTWHCLVRFRERSFRTPGAAEVAEALRLVLVDAEIARVPPAFAAGQEAERWAIAGDLAFPLARDGLGGAGAWTALTCLTR
jgi:hypothetical protein